MDNQDIHNSSAMFQGLRITEEQFNNLYPDLEGFYDFFNSPPPPGISTEEFERKYLASKLWRLNNIYTIIDKSGNPATFRMNYAQHKVYAKSREHPRIIILKSRQQGISTLWLVSYFDDAVWCPFLNLGLMAQGTDEASTLLERTKFLWDTLDPDIKQYINVSLDKDNAKSVSFSNKSNIFIRVSFRSATLQRLHISEFGKIANQYPKRAKETKTGTLQALARGNTGVIESTAEGRNMFKTMWDESVLALHSGHMSHKDFYPIFLSWLDDPDCVEPVKQAVTKIAKEYFERLEQELKIKLTEAQKNFWIVQHRELGGDVYQEYPATPEEAFTASRDGTFYSRQFNEHVVRRGKVQADLYDPNLPVDVYFDLGVDDYMVLGFVQWYRGEWRIVHEYWNNGYALQHYLDYVHDTPYDIRSLRLPHDIKAREQTASDKGGRAKSRFDVIDEYRREHRRSYTLYVLPRQSIEHGIETVRWMIPKMRIDKSCTYLIDCFLQYSKEWDDKLQVWKKTPLHDEYSHGADVLRSIASNTIESEDYNDSRLSTSIRHRSSGVAL